MPVIRGIPQAQYVVIAADGRLTDERVLTGTSNQIVVTDNGAGSTVVLSLPQNIHTGASPTFTGLTLSGLTAGSVVFAGSGGLISQDNTKLFFDDTNNRLGIGTASPSHQLHQTATATLLNAGSFADGGTQQAMSMFNAALDENLSANARMVAVNVTYTPTNATNRIVAAMFGLAGSASSQSLTSTSLRGLNGQAYYNGTGTVNEATGGYYLAQADSAGTVTSAAGVKILIGTTNASAVITSGYGVKIDNLVNSGTFTNTYGVYIGDVTAGTQTNQAWSLYCEDTGSRSFFGHSVNIGGSANRATTEGTNQIKLFDGTAPVGTLSSGVSLYSASGELRVMDAAGNSTLLSPHDRDGFWIHDEINFKGRRLRVDMEKLIKAIDQHLGGGYVTEA